MIYLDYHATTPLAEPARRAMAEALETAMGNPASPHAAGRAARAFVERARASVAEAIGARPADVVLTSSGTEACDLMVRGLARPSRVVTTTLEHPAVREACRAWEAEGVEVCWLEPTDGKPPSPERFASVLIPGALGVAQWANHETGTLLPVAAYADRCRQVGARLVIDAIQAFGRVPIDVDAIGASAVCVASHKVGGPVAAALWVDRAVRLRPRLVGGGQERGRRAGSQDPVVAAGFAGAVQGLDERLGRMVEVERWRDRLEATLQEAGAIVNGAHGARVASVVNASLPGWRSDVLVAALDLEGLCASAGAACSSGVQAPSPVLRSLYPAEAWRAKSALRLSLGPEDLDEAKVEEACVILRRVLRRR